MPEPTVPTPATPSPDPDPALVDQLRRYGHWVEQRGDVQLSPAGALAESIGDGAVDQTRRRMAPMLMGAAALVLAVGLGAMLVGGFGSDSPDSVVAAGSEPADDAGPDTDPSTALEEQPGALVVGPADGESAGDPADSPASGAPAAGPEASDTNAAPPNPESEGDGGSAPAGTTESTVAGTDDEASGTSSVPSEPAPSTTEPAPSTTEPATGNGSWDDVDLPTGRTRFLAPTPGSTMSVMGTTVLRAVPVEGATGYRFVGLQNGSTVFDQTVAEPVLALPNPMLGDGPRFDPGLATLRVVAVYNGTELGPAHTMEVLLLRAPRAGFGS